VERGEYINYPSREHYLVGRADDQIRLGRESGWRVNGEKQHLFIGRDIYLRKEERRQVLMGSEASVGHEGYGKGG